MNKRLDHLIERWFAVAKERKNFERAAATWREGDCGLAGVRKEVEALLTAAKTVDGFLPGRRFPDAKTLLHHIDSCSAKFDDPKLFLDGLERTQREWLAAFWNNALPVYDAVQAFKWKSPSFWDVLASKPL